ncbi:TolC family protein [Synechococcus sp. HB1133]|uniref:TolC family protein n=1 Tax=unclassified Synechococcus TaxID=2626047 RepID=UPI00140A4CAC|nr:TolC family protein [Synechococcus sp. PH41509]MCB4423720.1 TolC family protein [Synechococcus sp. HB1133]MCB4430639.1 TolC family protein [Synechococcus sp. HBA1120]NHI82667.1 TolC family protein [Synechococcus sp. HB1133]
MRRITASICLVAGVVSTGVPSALSEEKAQSESALVDQTTLPDAIELKGARPKADPSVVAPAVDSLSPSLEPLTAPPSLALPNEPSQVRIHELRPLTLEEALQLAEFNSPKLKAAASQVDQLKSALRAAIAAWYPTVELSASGLPQYFKSYSYQNPDFVPDRVVQKPTGQINPATGEEITRPETRDGYNERYGREWRANVSLQVSWDLINPARVPEIAAARDQFERAGDSYLIALRDLRLDAATAYFELQEADEGVRIGQASVKASLVSLRDARARFNAGVNTKLEVLEAETQLARDRNILTTKLGNQDVQRRKLASLLDLPQDITPTAASPSRPLGLWEPSLQESIVAAYNYREELDQLILDISINNSRANASLAAVQPVLRFVNSTTASRTEGQSGQTSLSDIDMGDFTYGIQNSTALTANWRLFDGGRARAQYRRSKQAAEESRFKFASTRDQIRLEVERSFFSLRTAIQKIDTTASEVLSSRESLRLSQLRVQAGVSTQREVVNNQRDVTQAELKYAQAIREYNTNLAQLRRRTGLDALVACNAVSLPATKPVPDQAPIPIEPTPLKSACPSVASAGSTVNQTESSPLQPLW